MTLVPVPSAAAGTPPVSATAIVLHAHPDDEAIFTGATIHRLASAGVRVVLVTATGGEAGTPRVPLQRGETMGQRRRKELETACGVLGVARLVMLGYEDSGAHSGPYPALSLGAAPIGTVTRQLTRIAEEENACAVMHYDVHGIYGHVDHVQVHRAGLRATRRLGITAYESTVDGAALRSGPPHVLHTAAGQDADVGLPAAAISFAVHATGDALAAKRAAMGAHASQIGPESLDPDRFGAAYRTEWFVRRGSAGPLERHLGAGD